MAVNKQRPPKPAPRKSAAKASRPNPPLPTQTPDQASAPGNKAQHKQSQLLLQRAARRPRPAKSESDKADEAAGGRLFVTALARGLDVLSAFTADDIALGNLELAERTGLPKPTISRITHTLTQLGYLSYDSRSSTYELGGRTLSLSYAALANLDVRRVARPIMVSLAEEKNLHIALAMRDKQMMLNIETCEGHGLVGLRLAPGSRMPIAVTAIGKAYLAGVSEKDRTGILDALRKQYGDEWSMIAKSINASIRDIEARGFCTSAGEWRKDINAVGAPIIMPNGSNVYALSLGGPAYLVSQAQLDRDFGPALADAARRISASLGGTRA